MVAQLDMQLILRRNLMERLDLSRQPIQAPMAGTVPAKSAASRSGFAEVNGTRLYYETAGTGDAIVLLHGLAADSRYWQVLFDALAQHYQVVRYDLRGFGQSALPTSEPYTHADDLRALLDFLAIKRAHVLGNSFGGVNAINFALAYPAMTRSLILVGNEVQGAEGLPPATAVEDAAWAAVFAVLKQGDKRAAAEAVVDRHPYFIVAKTMPAVRSLLVDMFSDYSWWHFQGNQDPVRLPEIAAAQRLGEIKVPTLVIIGALDHQDIQVFVDMTVQGIPDAQKVVMPDLDHVPFLENPAGFHKIVLDFLADQ
jgi:3-oxoadipate enol-lactonase